MHGQSMTSEGNQNETFNPSTLAKMDPNPQFRVVIDSTSYKVENHLDSLIKPDWIESISVFKDPTSNKLYGSENGVIFVYIKKEYGEKVLEKIKEDTTN
jgi:hypothetical protein